MIEPLLKCGGAFEGRVALMHLPHLTTVEEAISAMAQEGTRLKQMEKVKVVPKPAYYMSNRQETHDCHNCGIKGHLSHNCLAPRRGCGRGMTEEISRELEAGMQGIPTIK
jgi:hypothetical protein